MSKTPKKTPEPKSVARLDPSGLQLGHDVAWPTSPDNAKLDRVPNPQADTNYVVRFTAPEFTSLCPVTGQPDFSTVEIVYRPLERCVESKSLKLYLWSFRDKEAFAERLACDIAEEVQRAAEPQWVKVVVHQHVRGGIALDAVAELGSAAG